jgi:hypothetical protein
MADDVMGPAESWNERKLFVLGQPLIGEESHCEILHTPEMLLILSGCLIEASLTVGIAIYDRTPSSLECH